MNKKALLLGILVLSILLIGCTKNVYYTAPAQQQDTPQTITSSQDTKVNLLSQTQERELLKQWMKMYGEYDPEIDEDDLDEGMNLFSSQGLHPIKLYKGSMIFYEESYGYLFIPDYDDDFRKLPVISEDKFRTLAQKHNGDTTVIPNGQWAASFQNLNEIQDFLTEFWII